MTFGLALFVPFTTQELFQSGDESLYYGLNALSNNLIMVDRKLLKNPNGLILGTPGSGKSFAVKREIANAFLVTDVTHSGAGEGLIFYGNVILPFVDRFPTDIELYRIMTTKLSEITEAKEEGK